jgi:hypothetical protein
LLWLKLLGVSPCALLQAASQQGYFLGRLFSKNFDMEVRHHSLGPTHQSISDPVLNA